MSLNALWSGWVPENRPLVLAHRGGKGPWRENTVEAFAGALALGADGVELDVRLTADRTVVVHHDPTVEGLGAIAQLRSRDLPSWMTTLPEALAACAGALVNVEIKSSPVEQAHDPVDGLVAQVSAIVRPPADPQVAASRVVVSSFSPASLLAVRAEAQRAGFDLPTGLLVHPAFDARDALEEAKSLGCAALHPFHAQIDSRLVELAHEAGMGVVAWTVNARDELGSVLGAGVDGVITDEVTAVLEMLGR